MVLVIRLNRPVLTMELDMYGVIRRYQVASGSVDEIARRAQEGFVPLIRKAPGFVSYSLADFGNGSLLTYSVFEAKAGADESVKLAAGWVKENLANLVPTAPEVTSGEIRVRSLVKPPKYVVLRRYKVDPKNIDQIVARVQDGLLPRLSKLPGFGNYSALDVGGGNIASISGFETKAGADESVRAAAGWVKDNLSSLIPNPPEVTAGGVKFVVTARPLG